MSGYGRWVACFALLSLAGCEESAEPEPARKESVIASRGAAPTAVVSSAPAGNAQGTNAQGTNAQPPLPTAERKEAGIHWTAPPGWKPKQSPSSMRLATYEVPASSVESGAGELAIFYFGPQQGGEVDANLRRWEGQFQDVREGSVKHSERRANGMVQHVIEIPEGTYSNRMGPGPSDTPQPRYGLLGAVVAAPSGNYFFKLTAPSGTVKAQREAFLGLLDSVKPKSP